MFRQLGTPPPNKVGKWEVGKEIGTFVGKIPRKRLCKWVMDKTSSMPCFRGRKPLGPPGIVEDISRGILELGRWLG